MRLYVIVYMGWGFAQLDVDIYTTILPQYTHISVGRQATSTVFRVCVHIMGSVRCTSRQLWYKTVISESYKKLSNGRCAYAWNRKAHGRGARRWISLLVMKWCHFGYVFDVCMSNDNVLLFGSVMNYSGKLLWFYHCEG